MIDAIDLSVREGLGRFNVPGAAAALVDKGQVIWEQGYGTADKEHDVGTGPDTVFQVASISKTLSAWGIMRLVEQGRLDLDAPAQHYLSRWHLPDTGYDRAGVTIRRLLSHTAGLSLHGYPGFEPEKLLPSLEESLSGATNGAGDVRMVNEAGVEYSYSGGGYTLLQLIMEEVTGVGFVQTMQQEVLLPLGMTDSSFEWSPSPNLAKAYDKEGGILPNYLFTAKAAAGLYTTARDLAHFVAAHMPTPFAPAGRGVIKPETLNLMISSAPATNGCYGLGYQTQRLDDGRSVACHSGSNRGWRSCFAVVPELAKGIVVLTNSDGGYELIKSVLDVWKDELR